MRTAFLTIATGVGLMAAVAYSSPPARAERVCTKECSENVCREKCVERDRDREHVNVERREERHEDHPGVELKAPGVGVEIGH